MKHATSLLRAPLLALTLIATLNSMGQGAKEENSGYLLGGLNLMSARYLGTSTGVTIGMGSEFYFGNYIAEKLRFGLNMGWFNLVANFPTGGQVLELQVLKPGFLFGADLSEKVRLDFKYSLMPTMRVYVSSLGGNNGVLGLAHGPYAGVKVGKFTIGLEYVGGRLRDTDDLSRAYLGVPANSTRVLFGYNY